MKTNWISPDISPPFSLINNGIYLAGWSGQQFVSTTNYSCKEVDNDKALSLTKTFFSISEVEHKLF